MLIKTPSRREFIRYSGIGAASAMFLAGSKDAKGQMLAVVGAKPPAGGGGTPPATNRTLWIDFTQNATLYQAFGHPPTGQPVTNGQAVQGAADPVGTYQLLGVSTAPVLLTSGLNGRDALDGTATSTGYIVHEFSSNTAIPLSSLITASSAAVLASVRIVNDCAAGTIGNGWADASPIFLDNQGWFAVYGRSAAGQNYIGISNYPDIAEIAVSKNTNYIVVARHSGGFIYISVNNGSETSTASGNTQVLTAPGSAFTSISGGSFPGYAGELLVYNAGAFPTAAYSYMAGRW